MGKSKPEKWAELEENPLVIQPSMDEVFEKDHPLKGRWKEAFFKNSHPLVLELGCGKGEYTLALSERFPEKNYLGIDIKGARIWKGAQKALAEGRPNVGFIRTRIEFIRSFFAPGEVSEIWITFPDPQLKKRRNKKRLTAPRYLESYRNFLREEGCVHLKTDSKNLYHYTHALLKENQLEIECATDDLYRDHAGNEILAVQTYYEQQFRQQGKRITYLRFRLSHQKALRNIELETQWDESV